jgi:hypothetical protein
MPSPEAIATELKGLMSDTVRDLPAASDAEMQIYTARDSARALAEALDRACTRGNPAHRADG